jgi:hypothetical protein
MMVKVPISLPSQEVLPVPQASRVRVPGHLPHVTLNTDGRRHPVENALTVFVFVAGIASFAIGFVVSLHLAATVIGLVAFAAGCWAQMVSATREERIFIVTGMVGAFVGLGLGIAHGGFTV